jgi:3-oxoacyl-[acyl-carrier protein] reductase
MTEQPRVVVILGAGGTLGGALVRKLASEPDTDLVLSDVNDAAVEAAAESVAGAGAAVETALADIGELEQVEAVVRHAVERFGGLDVLISNAGVLA